MSQSDTNTENCDLIVIDNLSDEDSTRVVEIKSDSDQNEPSEELNSKIYNYMENIEKSSNNKQPPLVHLKFRNKNLADICLKEVEALIRGHLSQDRTLNILENEVTNLEIYSEFAVDNFPAFENDDCIPQEIPLYNISHDTYLEEEKEESEAPSQETPVIHRRKMTCFNCGGDHMVNNCTLQLDYKRINKNRREMTNNSTPKSSRYHAESLRGVEQTRNKGVPGRLSEELREALDLRPNQLPPYIYKMRVLGYPPGWLKEAEVQSSGITMYDSQGKAIFFNAEDGEVDMNEQRVQYDPCKLVDYVGFNVMVPPDIIDEHAKYNMPPIQYHHLRTEVEKNMKTSFSQPFRKRKFPTPQNVPLPKDAKVEDMEVEEVPDGGTIVIDSDEEECKFIPPLPREPLPPPPEDEEIVLHSSSGNSSPSLSELETTKQKLMKELEDNSNSSSLPAPIVLEEIPVPLDSGNLKDPSSSNNSSDVPVAATETASTEATSEKEETSGKNVPPPETDSSDGTKQVANSEEKKSEPSQPGVNSIASPLSTTVVDGSFATPSTPKCRSVSVTPGTPVLYENSPFNNLPSASKFAEGVSDYLPFENLPESTGVYEKMRGILSKVRKLYSS